MAPRLLLTHAARRDLDRVKAWYEQPGSGQAAARRLACLFAAIDALPQTPYRWRNSPAAAGRMLIAEGHRVLYRIEQDTGDGLTAGDVIVVRVFGPGQEN